MPRVINRGLHAAVVLAALGSALALEDRARAAVLHDQYAPLGLSNGLASNDAAGPNNASEAADDFTIPAGTTWTIDSIDVRGNNTTPAGFNVTFYANATSLPGAVVASRPAMTYSGTSMPDKVISLAPAVMLTPGTYWLGIQGANNNSFGWVETTSVRGAIAAWRAENVPACVSFMTKGSCVGLDPIDQAFRLNGQAVPQPTTTAPVAKKKCKKKKGKKRAAEAKKKKCKKKKRKR
jgi:hypothetical protein